MNSIINKKWQLEFYIIENDLSFKYAVVNASIGDLIYFNGEPILVEKKDFYLCDRESMVYDIKTGKFIQ